MISITLDIVTFLKEMEIAEDKMEHVAEMVFHDTADLIYKNAVNWTPVGNPALWKNPDQVSPSYEPGQLKGSWRLEFQNNREATLSNPMPYAYRVEYGSWSTQAPEGMLRRAIALAPTLIKHLGVKYKI